MSRTKSVKVEKPVKEPKEKNPFYIKGEDLKRELRSYRSTNVISEPLGVMLITLAKKYATRWNFRDYTNSYKDEFIGDALLKMVQYLHRVDPDKNPFCYLTCVCESCFRGRIAKENKFGNMKKNLCLTYMEELELSEGISIIQKDENDYDSSDIEDLWSADYDGFINEQKAEKKKGKKESSL